MGSSIPSKEAEQHPMGRFDDESGSERITKMLGSDSDASEVHSRAHWTSDEGDSEQSEADAEAEARTNKEILEMLRRDPNFSQFFSFTFPGMKIRKKFAEGSEGEIYEAEFTLMQKKFPCVLKVFKHEVIIELRKYLPRGILNGGNSVFPGFSSGTSSIFGGLVLQGGKLDGRFAIVMRREWGDLRTLIDRSMEQLQNNGPPFSDQCAKKMMLKIALGMQQLHNRGILHRDLKSINVLVSTPIAELPKDIDANAFHVKVVDFEGSGQVIGTGFWRAPEILQAVKERQINEIPNIVSKKTDIYAYAMTCYELLTGLTPFHDIPQRNYKHVISGHRPELPDGMDDWLKALIQNCWHRDLLQRPEFEDIVKVFRDNFSGLATQTIEVKERIAASKVYWSTKPTQCLLECEMKETSNRETFVRLKENPLYAKFFSYTFHNLELKFQIAKGGQAEIFEGEFEKENGIKVPCVVKVFDPDFSLLDMVNQWPPGMLNGGGDSSSQHRFGFMGLYPGATRTCEILGAVVLEESDAFAFIFNQEGGDLRTLIDDRMKQTSDINRPFAMKFAMKIIYEIALGMQHLHDNGILHRDLKAANVLVTNAFGEFPTDVNDEIMDIKVADFECSMLVVGTNFWRAPEVLEQLKSRKERIYTKKADVYSYGMTCYEVLTGGVPLEDRGLLVSDFEAVYRGERPILPNCIDDWLRKLLEKCWHPKFLERPHFKEIIEVLESNCYFPTYMIDSEVRNT